MQSGMYSHLILRVTSNSKLYKRKKWGLDVIFKFNHTFLRAAKPLLVILYTPLNKLFKRPCPLESVCRSTNSVSNNRFTLATILYRQFFRS